MAVSEKLLAILVCPELKLPVTLASAELIATLNTRIRERELRNEAGNIIELEIDEGLVRNDQKVLYPVRDSIPIMLIDERIPLS
jgi:uncharacterized protein YbaR (Trm112 family)